MQGLQPTSHAEGQGHLKRPESGAREQDQKEESERERKRERDKMIHGIRWARYV